MSEKTKKLCIVLTVVSVLSAGIAAIAIAICLASKKVLE